MDAFAKQDATALSMLYTEDCKLMPTGSDVLVGRDGECASSIFVPPAARKPALSRTGLGGESRMGYRVCSTALIWV